eukprot:gene29056-36119_t
MASTASDLVKLPELTESTVLENLRKRYAEDLIYTCVGDILVTLNPFKLLPIYTPEVLERYMTEDGASQAPHIFKLAD